MSTSSTPASTAAGLGRTHLFKTADLTVLDGFLNSCPVTHLARGESLIRRGEPNDTVYLVLGGELSVHLDDCDTEPIIVLRGGESVGEMSVIDNHLASATVVAETDCRLLAISEQTLWEMVAHTPVLARNLLHSLSRRLRHSNALLRRHKKEQEKYARFARTDSLTDTYNRRWLDEVLPRQIGRCRRRGWPFSLLLADLDLFKAYNDTHGHMAGDQAIRRVATTIKDSVRQADFVARFGGEEFLVLLPHADIDRATLIAERICRSVQEATVRHTDGRLLPSVTISIGLAQSGPDHDQNNLIEAADQALYRAKKKGRNGISR